MKDVADLIDEMHEYYPAKERLQILLIGPAKDICSAEIRFTYCKVHIDLKEIMDKKYMKKEMKERFSDFSRQVDMSLFIGSLQILPNIQ